MVPIVDTEKALSLLFQWENLWFVLAIDFNVKRPTAPTLNFPDDGGLDVPSEVNNRFSH